MSALPSFAWPAPELVGLLGADYMRERLSVVTSGYSLLCGAFSGAVDDFVSPLVTLSDDEVLRVVRERRARSVGGMVASPLELRDVRTHSAVLAEHGAAEVAEFDRWLQEKRARRARVSAHVAPPHQHPEVVASKVAVMVAKNALELEATKQVQKAVEDRTLEAREALLVTTSRLEGARVKRAVAPVVATGGTSSRVGDARDVGRGSSRSRVSRSRCASWRSGTTGGAVSPEAVEELARTLEGLRSQVYAMQKAAPVVDYDDMGEVGSFRDNW